MQWPSARGCRARGGSWEGEEAQAAAPCWGTKAASAGRHGDLGASSPCRVAQANAPSLDLDFFLFLNMDMPLLVKKDILIVLFTAFVCAERTEEGRFRGDTFQRTAPSFSALGLDVTERAPGKGSGFLWTLRRELEDPASAIVRPCSSSSSPRRLLPPPFV